MLTLKRPRGGHLLYGMIGSLLLLVCLPAESQRDHRDYVPNEKTADRIAEAVLMAQYGEQEIRAQLPLLVDGSNKQYWIVQLSGGKDAPLVKGGGPAVWIDRHSGCLRVMERMK